MKEGCCSSLKIAIPNTYLYSYSSNLKLWYKEEWDRLAFYIRKAFSFEVFEDLSNNNEHTHTEDLSAKNIILS